MKQKDFSCFLMRMREVIFPLPCVFFPYLKDTWQLFQGQAGYKLLIINHSILETNFMLI